MFAEYKPYSLKIKNKPFILQRPQVMGILNATEDSFYDGGKFYSTKAALQHVESMLKAGADIIDIGGQSTRPGAEIIGVDQELQRVVPLVEAVLQSFPDTILSIDTFHAQVAQEAVEAGASIVNDVSAGEDDPDMLDVVAQLQVPYIAMHKKGQPKNMQDNPQYHDVCTDVINYLDRKKELCLSKGITDFIADPGFGFGKTLEHNYRLMKHLHLFNTLNCPLLIGISRKSMIHRLLNTDAQHALNGSSALHLYALLQGAHIIRVHDVKEAVEILKIEETLRRV